MIRRNDRHQPVHNPARSTLGPIRCLCEPEIKGIVGTRRIRLPCTSRHASQLWNSPRTERGDPERSPHVIHVVQPVHGIDQCRPLAADDLDKAVLCTTGPKIESRLRRSHPEGMERDDRKAGLARTASAIPEHPTRCRSQGIHQREANEAPVIVDEGHIGSDRTAQGQCRRKRIVDCASRYCRNGKPAYHTTLQRAVNQQSHYNRNSDRIRRYQKLHRPVLPENDREPVRHTSLRSIPHLSLDTR